MEGRQRLLQNISKIDMIGIYVNECWGRSGTMTKEKIYDSAQKRRIYRKAKELGAELTGVCAADSWEKEPIQEPEFWPQNIWPWARSVIVLAIPLFYPMACTAPSMLYQEQYDTSNRIMDDMAYHLAKYLMIEEGCRAFFFPRDCYDNIEVLLKNPAAAFSHVMAGYYAGLGTIGDSHNLLTRKYGARIRIVSVITDAEIEPDEKCSEDLCIHCGKCKRECPAGCFEENGEGPYRMDKTQCIRYHIELVKQHHWPCGHCATFCPVGEDLKLYRGIEAVTATGAEHCRKYGS